MNTNNNDTAAWVLQVWLSFAAALSAAVYGIYNLPVELWIKGYLAMGLFYTIASAFTVSKTIRDNRLYRVDTQAWIVQVWVSFAVALTLVAYGILELPVEFWVRGYVGVGMLFVLTSSFTLAKTIRDRDEAAQAAAQAQLQQPAASGAAGATASYAPLTTP